jgi:hypothetical protein
LNPICWAAEDAYRIHQIVEEKNREKENNKLGEKKPEIMRR